MVSTASPHPSPLGSSIERAAAYMAQLEADYAARHPEASGQHLHNHHQQRQQRVEQQQQQAAASAPTPLSGGRLSVQAKNRRWAKLQQLEGGGEFFSETAMRQRAPGLWHEHIGRHEGGPPAAAAAAGPPGESWAHQLLRAHDAAQAQVRLEAEQAEDDAQMSEQEDDDNDNGEGAGTMGGGAAAAGEGGGGGGNAAGAPAEDGVGGGGPAAAAAVQRRHDFLQDMRARFLCGEEGEYVDYGEVRGGWLGGCLVGCLGMHTARSTPPSPSAPLTAPAPETRSTPTRPWTTRSTWCGSRTRTRRTPTLTWTTELVDLMDD
jgi:hypothetical protein